MKRFDSFKKALKTIIPPPKTTTTTNTPSPKTPAAATPLPAAHPLITLPTIWATSPTTGTLTQRPAAPPLTTLTPTPVNRSATHTPACTYSALASTPYSPSTPCPGHGACIYAPALPRLLRSAKQALFYAESGNWAASLAAEARLESGEDEALHAVEFRFVPLLNIGNGARGGAEEVVDGTAWAEAGTAEFWRDLRASSARWGASCAVVVRWGRKVAAERRGGGGGARPAPPPDRSGSRKTRRDSPHPDKVSDTSSSSSRYPAPSIAPSVAPSLAPPPPPPPSQGRGRSGTHRPRRDTPAESSQRNTFSSDADNRRNTIWPGPNAPKY